MLWCMRVYEMVRGVGLVDGDAVSGDERVVVVATGPERNYSSMLRLLQPRLTLTLYLANASRMKK